MNRYEVLYVPDNGADNGMAKNHRITDTVPRIRPRGCRLYRNYHVLIGVVAEDGHNTNLMENKVKNIYLYRNNTYGLAKPSTWYTR